MKQLFRLSEKNKRVARFLLAMSLKDIDGLEKNILDLDKTSVSIFF